jgi:flagellin-like protein
MKIKGITPIISIIVVLLIAVSLSAAAWTYISGYWGGLVGSATELTSTICRGGTTAVVYVHNIGTSRLNMTDGTGLEITRTDTGGTATFSYDPTDGMLQPGGTGQILDTTCASAGTPTRCSYDIVETGSGRLHQTYVTCSG